MQSTPHTLRALLSLTIAATLCLLWAWGHAAPPAAHTPLEPAASSAGPTCAVALARQPVPAPTTSSAPTAQPKGTGELGVLTIEGSIPSGARLLAFEHGTDLAATLATWQAEAGPLAASLRRHGAGRPLTEGDNAVLARRSYVVVVDHGGEPAETVELSPAHPAWGGHRTPSTDGAGFSTTMPTKLGVLCSVSRPLEVIADERVTVQLSSVPLASVHLELDATAEYDECFVQLKRAQRVGDGNVVFWQPMIAERCGPASAAQRHSLSWRCPAGRYRIAGCCRQGGEVFVFCTELAVNGPTHLRQSAIQGRHAIRLHSDRSRRWPGAVRWSLTGEHTAHADGTVQHWAVFGLSSLPDRVVLRGLPSATGRFRVRHSEEPVAFAFDALRGSVYDY